MRKKNNSLCLDCGINTYTINQIYRLLDHLWAQVNPAIEGMLCIECVEKRLGRQLTPDDFVPGQEQGHAAYGNLVARSRICRDGGAAIEREFQNKRTAMLEDLRQRKAGRRARVGAAGQQGLGSSDPSVLAKGVTDADDALGE